MPRVHAPRHESCDSRAFFGVRRRLEPTAARRSIRPAFTFERATDESGHWHAASGR
jgi:hypothetical protein